MGEEGWLLFEFVVEIPIATQLQHQVDIVIVLKVTQQLLLLLLCVGMLLW